MKSDLIPHYLTNLDPKGIIYNLVYTKHNFPEVCQLGAFKYHVILLGGGGSHLKDHKRSQGGRGVHQKITEDHDHKKGGALKRLVKLEVPIKIIITLRIRYQWVIQEVISS